MTTAAISSAYTAFEQSVPPTHPSWTMNAQRAAFEGALTHARANEGASTDAVIADTITMTSALDAMESILAEGSASDLQAHFLRKKAALSAEQTELSVLETRREEQVRRAKPTADIAATDAAIAAQQAAITQATVQKSAAETLVTIATAEAASIASLTPAELLATIASLRAEGSPDTTKQIRLRIALDREKTLASNVPPPTSAQERALFLRLNDAITTLPAITPESVAGILRTELSSTLSQETLSALSAMLTRVSSDDERLRTEALSKRTATLAERDALITTLNARMTSEFNAIIANRQTVQSALDLLRGKSQAYASSLSLLESQRNLTQTDDVIALVMEAAPVQGKIPQGVSLKDLEQQASVLSERKSTLVSWRATVASRIAAGQSYDLSVVDRELSALDTVIASVTAVTSRMTANLTTTLNAAYSHRLPAGIAGSAAWRAFTTATPTISITSTAALTDTLKNVLMEGNAEWQRAQNPLTTQIADLNKQLLPMTRLQTSIAALQAKADSLQRGADALRLLSPAHGVQEAMAHLQSVSPLQSARSTPTLKNISQILTRTIISREAQRTNRESVIALLSEAIPLLSGPSLGKAEADISLLQQRSQVLLEQQSLQVLKIGELTALMQQIASQLSSLDGAASSTTASIATIEDGIARSTIVNDATLQAKLTQLRLDQSVFAAERTTLLSEQNTQQGRYASEQSALTALQEERATLSKDIWSLLSARRRLLIDALEALGNYDLSESPTASETLAHTVDVQHALEKAFLRSQQEFHDVESSFALAMGDLLTARQQSPTTADLLLGSRQSTTLAIPSGATPLRQSPSGDRMAYVSGSTLFVENIDTRTRTLTVTLSAPLSSAHFSPSGSSLLVLMTNGTAVSFDTANGTVRTTHTFPPSLALTQLRYAQEGTSETWQGEGIIDPVTAERGTMLFTRSQLTGGMTLSAASSGKGIPVLGGNQMLSFSRSDNASSILTLKERHGALAGQPMSLQGTVLSVLESADKRTLFAITTQGALHAFSSSTLQPLTETALSQTIVDAAVSTGGRFFVALDSTGTLHVLNMSAVNDRIAPTVSTTLSVPGATSILGISEREVTLLTPQGITLVSLPAPATTASVSLESATLTAQSKTEQAMAARAAYATLFQIVMHIQQSLHAGNTELLMSGATTLAKASVALKLSNLPPDTARQIQSLIAALEQDNAAIAIHSTQASSLVARATQLIRASDLTQQNINWTQPPATRGVPEGALGSFVPHSGGNVYGATLSQAGGMIFTWGQDGIVNAWHTSTNQKVFSLNASAGMMYSGDISPDGTLAAFGTLTYPASANRLIFVDPHTGLELSRLSVSGLVAHIQFSPQGDTLLVGCTGEDGSYLIDTATRTVLARFMASHKGVFFENGKKILFTGESGGGGLFVYDIATRQTQSLGNPFGNCDIYAITANADTSLIGIAGRKERDRGDIGSFALLDGSTLQELWRTTIAGAGMSVSFSPSAPLVSVQPSNQSAVTFDLRGLRTPTGPQELNAMPYMQGGLLGPTSDSAALSISGYMYYQSQYNRYALAHPNVVAVALPTLPDYTYQTTASLSQSLTDEQTKRANAYRLRASHDAALQSILSGVSLSASQVQGELDRLLEEIQRLINPSYTAYPQLPPALATRAYPERLIIGSTVIDTQSNPSTGITATSVLATSSAQIASDIRTLLAANDDLDAGSTLTSLTAEL